MNSLHPWWLALIAYGLVFAESAYGGLGQWVGARVDVVPALMVFAAFRYGLGAMTLLAVWSGLCFDAMSANPLGVSVLPLFLTGFILRENKENLLHQELYAQSFFGAVAGAAVPTMTLLLLVSLGEQPMVGWVTLWQLVVLAMAGAVVTPLCFRAFDALQKLFSYQEMAQTTFRPDREIARGKS